MSEVNVGNLRELIKRHEGGRVEVSLRDKFRYYCESHYILLPPEEVDLKKFEESIQTAIKREINISAKATLRQYFAEYLDWCKQEKDPDDPELKLVDKINARILLRQKFNNFKTMPKINFWSKVRLAFGTTSFADVQAKLEKEVGEREWNNKNEQQEYINWQMEKCRQEDAITQERILLGLTIAGLVPAVLGMVAATPFFMAAIAANAVSLSSLVSAMPALKFLGQGAMFGFGAIAGGVVIAKEVKDVANIKLGSEVGANSYMMQQKRERVKKYIQGGLTIGAGLVVLGFAFLMAVPGVFGIMAFTAGVLSCAVLVAKGIQNIINGRKDYQATKVKKNSFSNPGKIIYPPVIENIENKESNNQKYKAHKKHYKRIKDVPKHRLVEELKVESDKKQPEPN